MEGRRSPRAASRPIVLLVEGHEDTRAMYALVLSMSGFDVVAAQGAAEGARRAREVHPTIIVTALPLPDADGWQFLQELKQNPRTRDIPVVAVSGSTHGSPHDWAGHDGFAAFFPKPCLPDDLAAGLHQVLRRAHSSTHEATTTVKRCPKCRQNTYVFTPHYAVLTASGALTRTGTDPHDGRERLLYQRAWVCQNARCSYRELLDE